MEVFKGNCGTEGHGLACTVVMDQCLDYTVFRVFSNIMDYIILLLHPASIKLKML